MVTIIKNSSGTEFSYGCIQTITVKQSTKMSIIKLPGANKDIIQRFGTSNREFTLDGTITVGGGTSYISALENTTGSLTYTYPLETGISKVTILFYNINFKDSGTNPMERKFSLEAVEIL
jgi:hypothetical protein